MYKVNPHFTSEINKYGSFDFTACFNCGTCTATCGLTDENNAFPRSMVRAGVLGLDDKIVSSLDPWLCYYCGECSTNCPRQAEPADLMMSLRRYLMAKYDWTGLSGFLFKKASGYFVAFLVLLAVIIGIRAGNLFNNEEWLHWGHMFEIYAIAGVFSLILLPNIIRMWYFTVLKNGKPFRFKIYMSTIKELFIHMFTQKRSLSCETSKDGNIWWFEHLMLVLGYLGLLFTTVALDWFNTGNIAIVITGYFFSAVIFIVTAEFTIRRLQKRNVKTSSSKPSDWFFLVWLMMMGISAFGVRLFIDLNILDRNFWLFIFHMIVLVQWSLVIVPFGKWTHFLYRSFAMYFSSINNYPEQSK